VKGINCVGGITKSVGNYYHLQEPVDRQHLHSESRAEQEGSACPSSGARVDADILAPRVLTSEY